MTVFSLASEADQVPSPCVCRVFASSLHYTFDRKYTGLAPAAVVVERWLEVGSTYFSSFSSPAYKQSKWA